MGCAFHNTSVHIRGRVPLVSIHHDIASPFFICWSVSSLFPFMSCDKSAATFSSQARFFNLFYDLLGFHSAQYFFKRFITPNLYILVNIFRINRASMCESNACLFFKCFIIIRFRCCLFKGFATNNMIVKNVLNHGWLDLFVSYSLFSRNINIDKYIATTITPATYLTHFAFTFSERSIGLHFSNLFLKFCVDLFATFSNAAQAQTYCDFYLALLCFNSLILLVCNDFHELSPAIQKLKKF